MLENMLFENVTQPVKYDPLDNKANNGLEALIKRAGKYEMETKTGMTWTFSGLLIGPGVRTPSGTYFDNNVHMFPELYQYCIGTDAEVEIE